MFNLMIVGASEAALFQRQRNILGSDFDMDIKVEARLEATLEECIFPVFEAMTPDIDALLLWALTPYAWEKTTIGTRGQPEITVFAPKPQLAEVIQEVPNIMTRIVRLVHDKNPNCRVHLVVPTVKDLYQFNQTQLIRQWGEDYADFLQDHPILNPRSMRQHSVQSYELFASLIGNEFVWPNKNVIPAQAAVNTFYSRSPGRTEMRSKNILRPPHHLYLSGQSLHLNSDLLPDGLHGTNVFLRYFMINTKRLFANNSRTVTSVQLPNVPSTSRESQRQNNSNQNQSHSSALGMSDVRVVAPNNYGTNQAVNVLAGPADPYNLNCNREVISRPVVSPTQTLTNTPSSSYVYTNPQLPSQPQRIVKYRAMVRKVIEELTSQFSPTIADQKLILDEIVQTCNDEKMVLQELERSNTLG